MSILVTARILRSVIPYFTRILTPGMGLFVLTFWMSGQGRNYSFKPYPRKISSFTLLDCVKSLLYLIKNPNFDSPNNDLGTQEENDSPKELTHRLLAGLTVRGKKFPANEAWVSWAIANDCMPSEEETYCPVGSNEDSSCPVRGLIALRTFRNILPLNFFVL